MRGKLMGIILGAVIILLAVSCGPAEEAEAPGEAKLLEFSRESLESGVTITVPPSELCTVFICIPRYQRVTGWHWHLEGNTENEIGSWLEDDKGNRISESGRTSSYDCVYEVGLREGHYYIYLSNEFDSTSAKKVWLQLDWYGKYLGK